MGKYLYSDVADFEVCISIQNTSNLDTLKAKNQFLFR